MRFASVWLAFLLAGVPPLWTGAQSPQSSNPQGGTMDSEAAKAVARKKRFEEEKRRLEGQEGPTRPETDPCTDGKPVLYITPTEAGMLVGESRGFTLFDTDNHNLTAKAEWSVSSSTLATLTPGAEPTVTARSEGTFQVIARVDTRTAEATVKVYPGEKLPIGAARWKVAPVPCAKQPGTSRIVSGCTSLEEVSYHALNRLASDPRIEG